MNRREFGQSLVVAGVALALPVIALPKPEIDHTWDGPHLEEFDDNDAIICTAHKAMGTLWYGNLRPEVIRSPARVVGRMWRSIIPQQRFKADRQWLYSGGGQTSKGFRFNGALWIADRYLTDEIILVNDHFIRDESNDAWKKLNGWYRASKRVLSDPMNDVYFGEMQQS